MPEKKLSIFIDESGDFGAYDSHAPFYLVTMVFHNQSTDIQQEIQKLEARIQSLGYGRHAIHTGPLIRREAIYKEDPMELRKRLFLSLHHFSRKLEIRYICVKIRKSECPDVIAMTARLSKAIADKLRACADFLAPFDRVVVYYDNGQMELTKILTSVFNTLYANVVFRKVRPVDYKLFQVADMICTMELLAEKGETSGFSHSEEEFFGSPRQFKKDYLKNIRRKQL